MYSRVKTTGVCSPTLDPIDTVLVLLFEGRTSCSTSYFLLYELCAVRVGPIHRGWYYSPSRKISALCRAGGKPSTGFPPGTRKADHLIGEFCFRSNFSGTSQIIIFSTSQFFRQFSLKFKNFHHFSS